MTPEENKLFIQRFVEETINRKNLDAINELVAANFVEHVPFPGQGPGREGLRYAVGVFLSAFPDIQWILDELQRDRASSCFWLLMRYVVMSGRCNRSLRIRRNHRPAKPSESTSLAATERLPFYRLLGVPQPTGRWWKAVPLRAAGLSGLAGCIPTWKGFFRSGAVLNPVLGRAENRFRRL